MPHAVLHEVLTLTSSWQPLNVGCYYHHFTELKAEVGRGKVTPSSSPTANLWQSCTLNPGLPKHPIYLLFPLCRAAVR